MPLEVHDVTAFYIPDIYYDIKEQVDCLIDMQDDFSFRVPNTNFYLCAFGDQMSWVYIPGENNSNIANLNSVQLTVDFEDVLSNVPNDIQEKLLFHLDIFRRMQ